MNDKNYGTNHIERRTLTLFFLLIFFQISIYLLLNYIANYFLS